MADLEKIDILVPTHGRLDLTMQCLDSLYTYTHHLFHLIVVDDSNPEEDCTPLFMERFCKTHKNVTFIHSDVPYKSGNQFFNIAIKNMQTKYLATVMNSMRVEPNWDVRAVELMNEDPKIGVVGFKCLYPHGTIECAGIAIHEGYLPIDIGRDLPGYSLTEIYEVIAIQWAFALIRREAAEGNLDETLFYGFKGWDDIDNCFALKNKGWKIYYCGFGVGIHRPRATRGDNSTDGYLKNRENGHTFFKRWGLWNNYMESKKMDVGEKIPAEMKANLTAVLTEYQMLSQLFESRKFVLQNLIKETLTKHLDVSPEKYVLGMDPSRDIWDLKMKPDTVPSNGKGEKVDEKELEASFKARQEAMSKKEGECQSTPTTVRNTETLTASEASEPKPPVALSVGEPVKEESPVQPAS